MRRASSARNHDGENKTGALTDITNTPQHNGKDYAETPNAPRKPALVHLTSKTNRLKAVNEDEKKTGDFGIDVTLIPWIVLSADKKVIIPTDVVTTIVEPIASVRQMFIDKSEAFRIKEEKND